jgi:hypothetical protein
MAPPAPFSAIAAEARLAALQRLHLQRQRRPRQLAFEGAHPGLVVLARAQGFEQRAAVGHRVSRYDRGALP